PAAAHHAELGGVMFPSLDAGVITVRQLMTHTSGLPRSHDLPGLGDHPSEAEVLSALDGLTLTTPPGENHQYSNLGGGLLGMIVSRAAGRPFRDYVRARLLEPLGIDDMSWDAGDVPLDRLAVSKDPEGRERSTAEHERIGPLESAGGLYGSVDGLAKLLAAHLDAWPARSEPERGPVPRRLLRDSHRMHAFEELVVRTGEPVRGVAEGTGLIWQVRQSCELEHLVWHNGSVDGYRSAIAMLPRRGLAVILLANAGPDLSPLAARVTTALVRDAQLPKRRSQPSRALSDALEDITRMYDLGNLNEPDYQRLFAPSFRERISLEQVRRVLASSRSRRGPCRFDRVLSSPHPHQAWIALSCDRGHAQLDVRLTTQPPHQIAYLRDDPKAADAVDDVQRCR
ncbi:MAG: serine hydrolase, partial [Polyangiaceae bacterium]